MTFQEFLAGCASLLQQWLVTNCVPSARTVNGHALSSDVVVTAGDLGLGSAAMQSASAFDVSGAAAAALVAANAYTDAHAGGGGGGGSPGGSSGQLQWNNGSTLAGVPGTTVLSNGYIGIGMSSPLCALHLNAAETCNATTHHNAAFVFQYSPVIDAVGGSVGEVRAGTSKLAGTSTDPACTLTGFESAVETIGNFNLSRTHICLAWPVMPDGAAAGYVLGQYTSVRPTMVSGAGLIAEVDAHQTIVELPANITIPNAYGETLTVTGLNPTTNWYGYCFNAIAFDAASKTHIYLGALTGSGTNRALWARANAGDFVIEDFAGTGNGRLMVDSTGKLYVDRS